MPFVVTTAFSISSPAVMTTTVQDIIDEVSQDIRKVLSNTGSDAAILLDYCNRVNLELNRASRWTWLQSVPQYFMTRKGQTDYWLGKSGGGPTGSVDTNLNLQDISTILEGTVFDRSNYKQLMRAVNAPLVLTELNIDGAQALRLGRPAQYRHDPSVPGLLHIYPGADNQNTFTPTPPPPICETTVSGALAARTYYVRLSYLDSKGGESAAGDETEIFVPANSVLMVQSPALPFYSKTDTGVTYPSYRVYASTASGTETLQATATLGTTWTETAIAPSATAYPTTSTIEPMGGYLIEFRYQQAVNQLTDASQIIQCPDAFKDVFKAGVNAYTAEYLKLPRESGVWFSIYNTGVRGMIRARNLQPNADFLRPDGAARL